MSEAGQVIEGGVREVEVKGEVKTLEIKPMDEWTWEEWRVMYPEGVPDDDPKQEEKAEMMRSARKSAMGVPEMPIFIIGPDGEIVAKEDFDKMTAGQRRTYTVGRTCDHYEHGVPGMSDDH